MLRGNLSTRPFYNERLVHLAIAVLGALVAVVTAVNLVRVVQLSQRSTELSAQAARDRDEAAVLAREANKIRAGIDKAELTRVVDAAREANVLIEGRTFSWTALFNYIEETLPPDVRLVSIRPTVDAKGARVGMVVQARRLEDVEQFMSRLESTGAFADPLPRQRTVSDEGLTEVSIEAGYTPQLAGPAAPAAAPDAAPPDKTPRTAAAASARGARP